MTTASAKIAIFTMLTRLDASSRAVCYDYEKYMVAGGIKPVFFPPSGILAFRYLYQPRGGRPLVGVFLRFLYWYAIVLPTRIAQILIYALCRFDAVFIERSLFRYNSWPFAERLVAAVSRLKRVKIIYELDDYLFVVSGDENKYIDRIKMADYFYTGNKLLLEKAMPHARRTFYYESRVDLSKYAEIKIHRASDVVVVGWAGTCLKDLDVVREAMSIVARKNHGIVFRIISNATFAHDDPLVKTVNARWSLKDEVAQLLGLDIGIMPLEDTDYNRSRQGYKLKTYMACGIPALASRVGYNKTLIQDGKIGFFADSAQEWADKILLLAADADLRRRMGKNAREFIENNFSMEKDANVFVEFLKNVAESKGGRV